MTATDDIFKHTEVGSAMTEAEYDLAGSHSAVNQTTGDTLYFDGSYWARTTVIQVNGSNPVLNSGRVEFPTLDAGNNLWFRVGGQTEDDVFLGFDDDQRDTPSLDRLLHLKGRPATAAQTISTTGYVLDSQYWDGASSVEKSFEWTGYVNPADGSQQLLCEIPTGTPMFAFWGTGVLEVGRASSTPAIWFNSNAVGSNDFQFIHDGSSTLKLQSTPGTDKFSWSNGGDFFVLTAAKGIVLKNAAGTVTKRVRLNDAGDGLLYEDP